MGGWEVGGGATMTRPAAARRPSEPAQQAPSAATRSRAVARIAPLVVTGGMLGVLESLLAISFGGLVFAGALATHAGVGIGMSLFAGVVVLAVVALRASLPGTIGSVQDITAAVLAVVAAGIVGELGADDPRLLGTVVVAVATTTVVTGMVLYLLGRLGLGQLARLVPYPVIGGFLAGTGWLLLVGGLDLLVVDAPALSDLTAWLQPRPLAQLLTGVVVAVALLIAVRRGAGGNSVPAIALAATAAFYIVVAFSTGVATAEANNWLLGPFPQGALWPPDASAFTSFEVDAILAQAPTIATVVVLSAVALLLNASGIELVAQRDADLDHELRVAGTANMVAGIGGGLPGFHALSLTNLAQRGGAAERITGIVAAAVVATSLLASGTLVAYVPRAVVGGLLAFLGLGFLIEWLVDGLRRLQRSDYLVVVLIVVVIALVGFLEGVAVGIAATIGLFLHTYSRTEVVRHELDATTYPSHVDRPREQADRLRERGRSIVILELQGFLFFGTAHRLQDHIASLLGDPERAVRHVVLDLHRLTGLDSSTVLSFERAAQLAAQHGATILLAGARGRVAGQLERNAVGGLEGIELHSDLDHAVQWCEDQLLSEAVDEPLTPLASLRERLTTELGSQQLTTRLLTRLDTEHHPAGTVLIAQDDRDRELLLVHRGTVTAILDEDDGSDRRLRTMPAGSIVGEVGFYLDRPRSARVVAETEVEISRLGAAALPRIEHEDPQLALAVHRLLARHLAARLADTLSTIRAIGS